jgi:hypothetical protein
LEKQKQKGKESRREAGPNEKAEEGSKKEGPDVDSELRRLEQQVAVEGRDRTIGKSSNQTEIQGANEEEIQPTSGTVMEYPKWIDYPWMYSRPVKLEFLDSWLKDWCDLILKWCQSTVHHVAGLKDFVTSKPFDRLPEKELRDILQYVVDRGLGKWIDKEKTVVRVMWRSLEEWASELYEWAYDNGVDMLDIFLIKSANKAFSTLPVSDIRAVMDLMVKNKQMKWIDKNHEQGKLIIQ